MATVVELERLAALTNRLAPLAEMRQGSLIRAEYWNTLAGAVIELARVLLAEGGLDAIADHEHVEEVDTGWLTPRLRALIEQGGLADPVTSRRLANFERDGQKLKAQLDLLQIELDKVRVGLSDVKIGDIGRASEFTILRRKFEAQSDARDEVLDLRSTLDTIQANIGRALEVGDSLTVGGELPNFDDLFGRVSELETLRGRLTNPDGTLLDATTLEIRLAELQGNFITQDQLDDALDDVRTRPPQDLLDQLTADLRSFTDGRIAVLREQQTAEFDQRYARQDLLDARINSLDAELRADTNTRVDALRGEVNQRFVTENGLESRLATFAGAQENVIGEQVGRQLDSRLDKLTGTLDQRYVTNAILASRLGALGTELQEQITKAVRGEMKDLVAVTLEEQGRERFISIDRFNAELQEVRKRLDDLGRRVGPTLDSVVSEFGERFVTLETLNGRLAPLEERTATVPEELIQRQVDAAVDRALGDLNTRIKALTGLESRISSMVSNQIDSLRQEMSSVAQQAVAGQLQGIQNSITTLQGQVRALDTRINTRIRDEITSNLRDFTAEIQAELNIVKQDVAKLSPRPGPGPIVVPGGAPAAMPDAPAGAEAADFTVLEGVGETFAQRLHAAGIRTFTQLAAASDEELAGILGTSVGQIRRRRIQAQAAEKT
jgi:predicted flap endonuclease-1-like 5' DNA nuclease